MQPNSSLYSPAHNMPGTFEATPWLQFQLSLAPVKTRALSSSRVDPHTTDWVHVRQMVTARQVAFCVLRALAPLRRTGAVRAAYFQRKEPGLRWRVAAGDAQAVRAALAPVLDRLCAKGQGLSAWVETVYEPESYLFGGSAAMHAVHALFDVDTAQWSALTALSRRGHLPYTDAALALAQTNELFVHTLGSRPEEVWDSWCRLAAFHDVQPITTGAAKRSRPTLTLLAEHPQAAVVAVALRSLAAAQQRAGAALAELSITGQLTQGVRGVLAATALFGWNRIGLTPHERRHVLAQALAAWHPHVQAPPQPAPAEAVPA